MESCALNGEGYCIERAEHGRVKAQTELGRYKTERERWGPRLREFKKGSGIKREGRLDVD